jgi:Ca2+-binding EF-hand superfamily protein
MKTQLAMMAAALLSTAALAQEPGGQTMRDPFDALDTDKNGSISLQEAQVAAVVVQNFPQADKDRDGKLTRDEFNAAFTVRQPEPGAQPPASPPQ